MIPNQKVVMNRLFCTLTHGVDWCEYSYYYCTFSFVNSKDYCCYSQCPYGFVFKKCFGLPAKTKNKNKPDYCVEDIFLGTFVDLVSRIAEVTC